MLLEVERRHHAALTIADLLDAPTVNSLGPADRAVGCGEPRSHIAVIQQGLARPAFWHRRGAEIPRVAELLGPDSHFSPRLIPIRWSCRVRVEYRT